MRSIMFLPASKPGNLLNADVYGADAIVIDLEDATSFGEKDSARILLKHALRTFEYKTRVIVRINNITTPWWKDDLEMIVPEKPFAIMPTKSYSPKDIIAVDEYITKVEKEHGMEIGRTKIIALLETAGGIEHAYGIATCTKRVIALSFGAIDYALDIKASLSGNGSEILYARSRLVNAARSAGIEAIDAPYGTVRNYEGLKEETLMVKGLGFNGKACIYPGQVEYVNAIFAPTPEEYRHAKAVAAAFADAEAHGRGVVVVDGVLCDGPAIVIAHNTVEEYERIYGVQE